MPRISKNYVSPEEKAKAKLLAFLDKAFKCEGEWRAYVEMFGDGKWGLRLAEIGVQSKTRMAGGTHFRSEAQNAVLFLRCEDLLMQWAYKVGPEDDVTWLKKDITRWLERKFVVLSKKKGRRQPWLAQCGVWDTIEQANLAIEGFRSATDMKGAEFCVRRMEDAS